MIPQSEFQDPQHEEWIGFARDALGLSESVSITISPLERRGSDRVFFRLKWNRDDSAILTQYDPKRVENVYWADIALFLHGARIPVPRVIRHDPLRCLILMEDLGDTDLWSFRSNSWESRRNLYQETLLIAHRLHSFPEGDFPAGQIRLMERFGPELYRWERDYFRDHFVRGVCGIKLAPILEEKLEEELSRLSERLAKTEQCLIHRDLQSQNVMVRDGEPFFIDFQGMRFGSLFYDLGSLLCDPYVEFNDDQRTDLLAHYYGLSNTNLRWKDFQNIFWQASAQRLMQALGAYGFLGLKKGLKSYLDHIPRALENLQNAAKQAISFPRLSEIVTACQGAMEQETTKEA